VTELDERNRRNFIDLFKAISAFDGYRVGELMVERSRTPDTAVEPEVFALKVQRLVQHIKSRTFALGSVKLGDLLGRMLSMVRQHHVRMEGDFVTVVLSILLLEGIGRQLEPDIDLFKSSIPILRQLGPTHPHDFSFGDDTLSMLKVWLVLEVRQFINASIQDVSKTKPMRTFGFLGIASTQWAGW
jgi:aarF domain-containing kinase